MTPVIDSLCFFFILQLHPTLSTAPIVLRFLQNQNWRQFLTVNVDGREQKWTGQTSINNALKKISGKVL